MPGPGCRPGAGGEQIGDLDGLVGEVVGGVGVVPEDPEVGSGGAHRSEPGHGRVAVAGAVRVAVLRHAPDALDRRVLGDEPLHGLHVRAVRGHRHRDHVDPEALAEREVPVVAGHRTQERDPLLVHPARLGARHHAQQGVHQAVVHQLEAGVPGRDQLAGRHLEHPGEDLPELGQPLQPAVVAYVGAVGGGVPPAGQAQQVLGEVELLGGGLAPGEVEREAQSRQVLVVPTGPVEEPGQCVGAQLGGHGGVSSRRCRSEGGSCREYKPVRASDGPGAGSRCMGIDEDLAADGGPGEEGEPRWHRRWIPQGGKRGAPPRPPPAHRPGVWTARV